MADIREVRPHIDDYEVRKLHVNLDNVICIEEVYGKTEVFYGQLKSIINREDTHLLLMSRSDYDEFNNKGTR